MKIKTKTKKLGNPQNTSNSKLVHLLLLLLRLLLLLLLLLLRREHPETKTVRRQSRRARNHRCSVRKYPLLPSKLVKRHDPPSPSSASASASAAAAERPRSILQPQTPAVARRQ